MILCRSLFLGLSSTSMFFSSGVSILKRIVVIQSRESYLAT